MASQVWWLAVAVAKAGCLFRCAAVVKVRAKLTLGCYWGRWSPHLCVLIEINIMRAISRLLITLVISASLPALASAEVAEPDGVDRETPAPARSIEVEAVLLLLSAHHQLPESERFETVTPNVEPILHYLTHSTDIEPLFRDRALEALSYFPNAQTFARWAEVFMDEDERELVRHRMLALLADNGAPSAIGFAVIWLQDDDVQRRLTAVLAMANQGVPGRTLLAERLEIEESELVREAISEALK